MIQNDEAEMSVGPGAIDAYSRLSYTMWHALAEFIDNSTQSRLNYEGVIDDVLKEEGRPLLVEITHDKVRRELRIKDNSIGMDKADLVAALKVAVPTKDSKGRSKYGMGMKTSAFWIGKKWKVITCEWSKGVEWTASVDIATVSQGGKIPLTPNVEGITANDHYTEIIISDLRRRIYESTEKTIRSFLGSMYRFDIESGKLKLLLNGDPIAPESFTDFDTAIDGTPYRRDLPPKVINGHTVRGWFGVLKPGAGGRKYGGFSLFQNKRQIQGFPNAWKPKRIFGGEDTEGANNLVAQRLTGLIELDGFEVSHTKDAILFQDSEEEELTDFLYDQTKDYCDYARTRRGPKVGRWAKEKVKDFVDSLKKEFQSDEMKDAARKTLPKLEIILQNNAERATRVEEKEVVSVLNVLPDLEIRVVFQERSEAEPYVTIQSGAAAGTLYVIINGLHPYYDNMETDEARGECIRQFIHDALAEYRVSRLDSRVNANSIRRAKDDSLRVTDEQIENAAAKARDEASTKGSEGRRK